MQKVIIALVALAAVALADTIYPRVGCAVKYTVSGSYSSTQKIMHVGDNYLIKDSKDNVAIRCDMKDGKGNCLTSKCNTAFKKDNIYISLQEMKDKNYFQPLLFEGFEYNRSAYPDKNGYYCSIANQSICIKMDNENNVRVASVKFGTNTFTYTYDDSAMVTARDSDFKIDNFCNGTQVPRPWPLDFCAPNPSYPASSATVVKAAFAVLAAAIVVALF